MSSKVEDTYMGSKQQTSIFFGALFGKVSWKNYIPRDYWELYQMMLDSKKEKKLIVWSVDTLEKRYAEWMPKLYDVEVITKKD